MLESDKRLMIEEALEEKESKLERGPQHGAKWSVKGGEGGDVDRQDDPEVKEGGGFRVLVGCGRVVKPLCDARLHMRYTTTVVEWMLYNSGSVHRAWSAALRALRFCRVHERARRKPPASHSLAS